MHLSSGCINSTESTILMGKEKILQRWNEYIRQIFQEILQQLKAWRDTILKPVVMSALAKMKGDKMAGPAEIVCLIT